MRISDWSSDVCSSDLDELATATETIAGSRDQMVAAVDALVELATLTNDTVIEPHAERLTALLEQVRPLLGTLAERSDILATLTVDLGRFVERFPQAVAHGHCLMLPTHFPAPAPSGNRAARGRRGE